MKLNPLLGILVLSMAFTGCGLLHTQVVKVPVPVPCISAPITPSAIPVEALTEEEAQGLIDAGLYGDLADRVAASIILLQSDRQALLAQQDQCSKIPASTPGAGNPH